MKRLVSTINLPKSDWLRYRKMGITGTDAGAIVGLNPYVSAFEVYQDKTTEKTEDMDNEAMRQGRDLEAYEASRFEEETGWKVRRANAIFQNEDHPIMLADFDRIVVDMPNGQRAGLECKTVSPYSADKWSDDNIPLHYQMQVQHYLAVSGFDCWYVAALVFGREFIIRKIERDEELIRHLITIEERFWKEHVMAQKMPAPDGTSNCSEMIAKIYYKADKDKTIPLPGCNDTLHRRQELDELIKKLEKEKQTIEQTRLDSKKLKEEQPAIYAKYCKTNISRRFTVNPAA